MKKCLIISSPFFGYQNSVGRAFQTFGYEVKIETYDEPINPFKGWLKLQHKLAKNKEKLRAKSREKYDAYIRNVYDQYQPDIVFIYDGNIMLYDTLDYFRQKSKVVVWMYDSVLNPRFARCEEHINHVDAMFCFDMGDVKYFESQGKVAYFLPLACDPTIYHRLQNVHKDVDISFVGCIYGSKKRLHLLKLIVDKYPQHKILIYGKHKPFEKNPIKWLLREKRRIYKNCNISPKDVNDLYNRSKICLNIHVDQTTDGANQRLFEVCGAGAYQICDYNPYIASLFPTGEVGLYKNEQELIELIDKALTNSSISPEKAQDIILNNHTFEARVKEILEKITDFSSTC